VGSSAVTPIGHPRIISADGVGRASASYLENVTLTVASYRTMTRLKGTKKVILRCYEIHDLLVLIMLCARSRPLAGRGLHSM
jgi:hypothetical protein